jgi:hypothetical protein
LNNFFANISNLWCRSVKYLIKTVKNDDWMKKFKGGKGTKIWDGKNTREEKLKQFDK